MLKKEAKQMSVTVFKPLEKRFRGFIKSGMMTCRST